MADYSFFGQAVMPVHYEFYFVHVGSYLAIKGQSSWVGNYGPVSLRISLVCMAMKGNNITKFINNVL